MLGRDTGVEQAQRPMVKISFRSIPNPSHCAVFFAASLALVAFSRAQAGPSGTLETKSFSISIEVKCEEGEVTCDNVKYVGTNKKTGESVELTGKTAHHMDKEGNPGRFLGYIFKNKGVTYFLSDEGSLRVTKGDEVLLEENGTWTWDNSAGEAADSRKKADSHKRP